MGPEHVTSLLALLGVRRTLLTMSVLLAMETGISTAVLADVLADQPPPELRMILAPGTVNQGEITFRAEEKTLPVREAILTPITVLPPEATAESALQRQALVAGKGRPLALSYPNSFTLGTGYRWDSVFFNIGPISGTPNILSELQYDNLESMTLAAALRWSNSSNMYVRGGVEIGRTLGGEMQDSDYLGDNRTLEFSRSHADSDGGSLLDATIGFGYRFDLPISGPDSFMRLMPLFGYSYHSQELTMTNGVQVLSQPGFDVPPLGPFDGLDSHYDAHWSGPWLGLDSEMAFNQRHALLASLEYHWLDYEAEADWNLRSDFAHPISFEHDAKGTGVVASITYQYTPNPKWFWTVGYRYSAFEADAGEYIIFRPDATEDKARFNEAEWESHAVVLGLGYNF